MNNMSCVVVNQPEDFTQGTVQQFDILRIVLGFIMAIIQVHSINIRPIPQLILLKKPLGIKKIWMN